MQQAPLIKEYLDILFRRKWWIIVPALLGLLFASAAYFRVPKRYLAETRVQTSPQSISEALLRPIVESNPQDQITTITAEITSERYVQEVDRELKLVGTPNGPKDLPELAKRLEAAIDLTPNPRNRYFDLKVSWSDPRLAAAIANKLAAIYIERYSEIRRELASGTLTQLRDNRIEIENRLGEVRARIEQFRAAHKFELDTFSNDNRLVFERNIAEVERLSQQIRDWNDQIEDIELQLQRGIPAAVEGSAAVDPRFGRLQELESRLSEERAAGRRDNHPAVASLLAEITRLQAELGVRSDAETPGGGTPGLTPDQMSRMAFENEKARLEREIALARAKITRLEDENRTVQARQERTPDNQIALDNMLQLEAQLAADYAAARNREMQAQAGEMVEELGKGEQFTVLNEARPPQEPYYPDFKLFLLMGLAVGLGLGVSIVLLLEVFDQSFKSEEQLAASIDLPILAVIPDLNRVADQSTRRRSARERRAS